MFVFWGIAILRCLVGGKKENNNTSLNLLIIIIVQELPAISERPAVSPNVENWPVFIGTVVYSFEGIGIMLPMQVLIVKMCGRE